MLERPEDIQSKEKLLLINKSLISRDVNSENNTNGIMNNIQDIK